MRRNAAPPAQATRGLCFDAHTAVRLRRFYFFAAFLAFFVPFAAGLAGCVTAAWAAARRATGTRKAEQLT